jgi:hypothetical protein
MTSAPLVQLAKTKSALVVIRRLLKRLRIKLNRIANSFPTARTQSVRSVILPCLCAATEPTAQHLDANSRTSKLHVGSIHA